MAPILLTIAKAGTGYLLAVIAGWVAYQKDRALTRLQLRLIRMVVMTKKEEE